MSTRTAKRASSLAKSKRPQEMTYWHKTALRMFRSGANTVGIASALGTTEADAYGLLSQAREAERVV